MKEKIIQDILDERTRQDEKWGEQNHKPHEWLLILMEEVGEVSKEVLEDYFKAYYNSKNNNYRAELIQVAAVALAMLECYDKNNIEVMK